MAKKESVKIEVISGEEERSTIFVLSQSIKSLDTYERAKAIKKFIGSETKVLETCIENHLREILRGYGIIPRDGSEVALMSAFDKLRQLGRKLVINDRYYEIEGERIIGESSNHMTVIIEDDTLSSAIEIIDKEI